VVNRAIYRTTLATYWAGTIGWDPTYVSLGYAPDSFTRETGALRAGVELPIGSALFVWVETPILGEPNVTIQNGGSMGVFGYQGGTTLVDHRRLLKGEEVSEAVGDRTLTVRRDGDDPDLGFKVFTITIS
jgi:hypothetical protein